MTSKYEVGDRFETRDSRDEGKIVEIIEVRPTRYKIKSEVNPKNPSAVGRETYIMESTLDKHYRKISR